MAEETPPVEGKAPVEPKETQAPKPAVSGGSDVEQNKVLAAISYFGILFVIPMAIKKDSPFAMYHARQGLALFIFEIILYFLDWVPFVGHILYPILGLVAFILLIIGLMNALGGKTKALPIIGSFTEKIKI